MLAVDPLRVPKNQHSDTDSVNNIIYQRIIITIIIIIISFIIILSLQ